MGIAQLVALERTEKGTKVRKQGFIPGTIYGKNQTTISVKFKKSTLISLLKAKGEKTKILLDLNGEEKLAIIKDVGRDLATSEIIHIDLQIINQNQSINLILPIIYTGIGSLKSKGLYVQEYISNIQINGDPIQMPECVILDVSNKNFGDKIKIKDIELGEGIKTIENNDTTLGAITRLQ